MFHRPRQFKCLQQPVPSALRICPRQQFLTDVRKAAELRQMFWFVRLNVQASIRTLITIAGIVSSCCAMIGPSDHILTAVSAECGGVTSVCIPNLCGGCEVMTVIDDTGRCWRLLVAGSPHLLKSPSYYLGHCYGSVCPAQHRTPGF